MDVEVRETINTIKSASRSCNDKTKSVIADNLSNISDEASARLPLISNLTRIVQNIRQKKIDAFPICKSLENLVIPEEFTVTNKNKKFLFHNIGDSKDKFLMFTTKKNIRFLRKCKLWQADGTFKCVPTLFCQLYTIHGFHENKTIPLVFFLLPNKQKKIYNSALSVLKNMMKDFQPEEINIDFESAFMKSFKKLFPLTRMKGCHFHFGQCIFRHIQECGFQTVYGTDLAFSSAIKMIISLAFVPAVDVVYAYEKLIKLDYYVKNEAVLSEFLNYFEATWIGEKKRNHTRGQPLFEIKLWNSYDYVLNDLPRTNNAVEGWHNGFAQRVGKSHAEVPIMIKSLKSEQNLTDVYIEQSNSGLDIAEPRKKKYKSYDDRIKRVVLSYDRNQVVEYLKNISNLINI